MARHEADKEDLIADATALIERAEYCRSGSSSAAEMVTVGFKRDGSLSLYFEQDPFYQFTADGLLRRAFESGFLYRSQDNTLARLERKRSEQQTTLQRSELTPSELEDFRHRMLQHVNSLLRLLESGEYERPRCISERCDLDRHVTIALRSIVWIEGRFWAAKIAVRK